MAEMFKKASEADCVELKEAWFGDSAKAELLYPRGWYTYSNIYSIGGEANNCVPPSAASGGLH